MNIHQNNEPVNHDDRHNKIMMMLDAVNTDGQVCMIILGDVELQPGRISVQSSTALDLPDSMEEDGVVLPAALSGMIFDGMGKIPKFAHAVMLAAQMYAERQMEQNNKIHLN